MLNEESMMTIELRFETLAGSTEATWPSVGGLHPIVAYLFLLFHV
jgi:hypothetical protein